MPHVTVKLWPGQSASSIRQLSGQILASVTETLGFSRESVSIAFEEVEPGAWMERVYRPEIAERWPLLTERPGYGPGPAPSPTNLMQE